MLILNLLLIPMLFSDNEDGDKHDDEPDGGVSDDVRCVHD